LVKINKNMKVKIIRDKCIGCGTCAALASDVFEMDDENLAVLKTEKFEDEESVKMTVDSCPTQAIEIEE